MSSSGSRHWINALWILFGLYWLISALKQKKIKKRETWSQRFRYVLPLVAASYLLARPEARYGWLGARFVPASHGVEWLGVLLTAAGVGGGFGGRWRLRVQLGGGRPPERGAPLNRTAACPPLYHPIFQGIPLRHLWSPLALG